MNDETAIRKLARSNYWQNIYKSSQENAGIKIFENEANFSGLQILFLYWLSVYNMIYKELLDKEWAYLSKEMVEDDIRLDAFLYYRGREISKKISRNKLEEEKRRIKSKGKHTGNITPFSVEMIRG